MLNGNRGSLGRGLTRFNFIFNWQGRFRELSSMGILRPKGRKYRRKDLLGSGFWNRKHRRFGLRSSVKVGSMESLHAKTLWNMLHLWPNTIYRGSWTEQTNGVMKACWPGRGQRKLCLQAEK